MDIQVHLLIEITGNYLVILKVFINQEQMKKKVDHLVWSTEFYLEFLN